MKTLYTFALSLICLVSSAQNLDLPDLEYLEGSWFTSTMNLYESWTRTDEGYVGEAYQLRNGTKVPFEDMTILKENGVWTFTAMVKGQEPVGFALSEVQGTKMTFRNPEHDYPNMISYWMGEDGMPVAYIEGDQEGQITSATFVFSKAEEPEEIPSAVLGPKAELYISVSNLKANEDFYKTLGFEMVSMDNAPWPWVRMTDGSVNIVLNKDGGDFFGLTYFDVAQKSRLATLADRGVTFEENKSLPILVAEASDPDGNFGFKLLEANRPRLKVPALMSEGACGKLGEIAIPVSNLDSARVFYEALGFETSGVYKKPYPWGIFSDGLMAVGLHQNAEFTEPALTYFSPNSAEHIERLKAAGLEVIDLSEKLGPGNAIVKSPQGYPVNIFMGDL